MVVSAPVLTEKPEKRPKRHDGDGSFRRKPNGSWEARIKINGKSHSFGGKTEREARTKMKAALMRTEEGMDLPDKRAAKLTVRAVVGDWLQLYVTTPLVLPRARRAVGRTS